MLTKGLRLSEHPRALTYIPDPLTKAAGPFRTGVAARAKPTTFRTLDIPREVASRATHSTSRKLATMPPKADSSPQVEPPVMRRQV